MQSNADLLSRVETLHRENVLFRRIGMAVLVLVAAVLAIGQSPSPKTVEAEAFVLRDSNGNIRAKLDTKNGTTEFLFYSHAGQPRMTMKLDEERESLEMNDDSGKLLATVSVAMPSKAAPTPAATIAALGSPGGPGVIMQAWKDSTSLRIVNKGGHGVWAAPQP